MHLCKICKGEGKTGKGVFLLLGMLLMATVVVDGERGELPRSRPIASGQGSGA